MSEYRNYFSRDRVKKNSGEKEKKRIYEKENKFVASDDPKTIYRVLASPVGERD